MNKPYIKEYNTDGVCTNPLTASYLHRDPNRSQRRKALRKPRFRGNNAGVSLTISNVAKYHRVLQTVINKDGLLKTIEHYKPV